VLIRSPQKDANGEASLDELLERVRAAGQDC
jgi:hypothetical protein